MRELLDELRSLDPRDPGRWPLPVRIGAVALYLIVLTGVLSYFLVWQNQSPDLDRYQVVQETRDRLRIRVLARPDRRTAVIARLRVELAAVLPPSVAVDFEPWEAEPPAPERKYRPVLSKVARS